MAKSVHQLVDKLSKYPKLIDRVERLLEIIENPDGATTLADDAEAHVVAEMRELGKEVLEKWGQEESHRQEAVILKSGVSVKKKGKKNSIGTPHTARSA
jgi:hypothetical protein